MKGKVFFFLFEYIVCYFVWIHCLLLFLLFWILPAHPNILSKTFKFSLICLKFGLFFFGWFCCFFHTYRSLLFYFLILNFFISWTIQLELELFWHPRQFPVLGPFLGLQGNNQSFTLLISLKTTTTIIIIVLFILVKIIIAIETLLVKALSSLWTCTATKDPAAPNFLEASKQSLFFHFVDCWTW